MLKSFILVIASFFLAVSVANATPNKCADFASISKADSEFLFDSKSDANVIALSVEEMK